MTPAALQLGRHSQVFQGSEAGTGARGGTSQGFFPSDMCGAWVPVSATGIRAAMCRTVFLQSRWSQVMSLGLIQVN